MSERIPPAAAAGEGWPPAVSSSTEDDGGDAAAAAADDAEGGRSDAPTNIVMDVGPWTNTQVVIVDRVEHVAAAVAAIRAEARDAFKKCRGGGGGDMSAAAGFVYPVGIDMEWVPLKRTGKAKEIPLETHPSDYTTFQVALLQIATASRTYLFRMCCYRQSPAAGDGDDDAAPCACPSELAALLTNTGLTQAQDVPLLFAGVGVDGDRSRFARDFNGTALAVCLEIPKAFRHAATTMEPLAAAASSPSVTMVDVSKIVSAGTDPACNSLADFASKVLSYEMPKDLAVTCSNWTRRTLSSAQVLYATADAMASRALTVALLGAFGLSSPSAEVEQLPPRAANLAAFVEATTPLKASKLKKTPSSAAADGKSSKSKQQRGQQQPGDGGAAAAAGQPAAEGEPRGYAGRKQPYYGNIKVLEPPLPAVDDGGDAASCGPAAPPTTEPRVLFTVSLQKADWYLKEDLATIVNEGVRQENGTYVGRVIQLRFKPNLDRGEQDRSLRPDAAFFATDKDNCCVVCGDDSPKGGVVRFFVVPQAYRKFFPREFVNHNSFDIVLVCVACMKRVNQVYEGERKRLEHAFEFPISWHSCKAMSAMKQQQQGGTVQVGGMGSPSPTAASSSGGDDGAADAVNGSSSTGLIVAEHNRTILNMAKAATALIMAEVAQQPVSAGSRARGKKVNLPPERFASLLLSIDEHLAQYVFPECAADVDNGTSMYRGKGEHWHDRYWKALKERLGDEGAAAPIVLPTTGEQAPNGVSWRIVFNVMRADRWKVQVRGSTVSTSDLQQPQATAAGDVDGGDTDVAAASPVASGGSTHFEFVVNEIMRSAVHGKATVGAPLTTSAARTASPAEEDWLRNALASSSSTTTASSSTSPSSAAKPPAVPKSGKPGHGPSTPAVVLEAVCRFIYRWRRLFLSQLEPRRMPQGWHAGQGLIGIDDDVREVVDSADAAASE